MIVLVFEIYGALCFFALAAFLVLAAVARLRPDLDEEELDLAEIEKLVSSEPSRDALLIEPPIIEEPSWSPPTRPAKHSKHALRRGAHLFHTRKPRTTFS